MGYIFDFNQMMRTAFVDAPKYSGAEINAERGSPIPYYGGAEINKQSSSANPHYEPINVPPVLARGITSITANGKTVQVWEQIKFPAGNYLYEGKTLSYPELILPASTLVDFEIVKTVQKTAIQGKRGTVKELIGTEDWGITIRGIITPGCLTSAVPIFAKYFPYEEVEQMKNLFRKDAILDIEGEIFSTLGIYQICVEKLSLPRLDGFPTCQPYVLQCSSDESVELVIKKYNTDL
jgi:hypothetical protein